MRRDQGGGASIELVILTPLLVVALLFVVALGRFASVRSDVDGATRDAARAASIMRTRAEAVAAAPAAATQTLDARDVTCQNRRVTADVSNFAPGGHVSVTVQCTVQLGDLSLLGISSTRTLSRTESAPIDRYRGTS